MIKSVVVDGDGSGKKAKVTSIGQQVVGQYAYDEVVFNELAEPNTAYNFYTPKEGMQFVITGVMAYADKQVGTTTGATVIVYEATDPALVTVSKTLIQSEMGQITYITFLPLNILVNEGVWVNAKTDDDDIHMTITGYYIPSTT